MKTIYNIGEIAKLLGVSSQQIRKYEKEGLLVTFRDESGYRYYEAPDFTVLMLIKKYRNIGFPVKTIKELLNSNLDKCLDLYLDCATQIDEKINRLIEMKKYVLNDHAILKQLSDYDFEIKLEKTPASKGFIYRKNRTIMKDFFNCDKFRVLMKQVPPLSYIIIYDKVILKKKEAPYSVGFACDKSYEVCFPKAYPYFESNEQLCVTVIIKHSVNNVDKKWESSNIHNDFLRSGVIDYIESNKYIVCGDIIGIKLFDQYNFGTFIHYIKYCIPVLTLNQV